MNFYGCIAMKLKASNITIFIYSAIVILPLDLKIGEQAVIST